LNTIRKIAQLILFLLLTAITQIGGIVFVVNLILYRYYKDRFSNIIIRRVVKLGSFVVLYLATTFIIAPILAKPLGRVPMPVIRKNNLRPLTIWTCLLNRHYVKPELKEMALNVAEEMNVKYPGTTINYLDGNFPFRDGFPLIPHLSHNDGRKLDLAFCYSDVSGNPVNDTPSFIGYGISEEIRAGEYNAADECLGKGFRKYGLLQRWIPQDRKKDYRLNEEKTKALIGLFTKKEETEKIFLEPFLKTRMKISSGKVRFQGCNAARHDDHFHVEVR
jgi:hypothetical protein